MKNIILLILFLLAISSCNKDFLNPKQTNLIYNDVFWQNEKDATTAVLGVYTLYRGVMVSAQMYERGDVTTGFFKKGHNGGSADGLYLPGDFVNVTAKNKSWGSLDSFAEWSSFYKVVTMANLTISRISTMNNNLFAAGNKSKLLGEVYFLRALAYYNIALIWGNAPLILEPVESSREVIDQEGSLINIPRSTDIAIMETVLKDVKEAIRKLEYGTVGASDWGVRANKGSAQALSGYANLWMAFLRQRDGQGGTQYIADAVKSLDSVVAYGHYSLTPYTHAAAIAALYKGRSSEAVFELNISAGANESYRIDKGGIQSLTCKVTPLNGDVTKDRSSSINWIPASKKQFIYPDYPADKRADLFFAAWSSTYEEAFSDVSAAATDRSQVTWLKKFAAFVEDPNAQKNEYIAYFADCNIPVFRYTDVKLLLAEAYIKNGQTDMATTIINEIRTRAGLVPYTGSSPLAEVMQQRTAELIGEGKIFFDYVRNNYFQNVPVMDANRYQQKGYYWPVSNSILTSNKLIQQTPFWNGKTTW